VRNRLRKQIGGLSKGGMFSACCADIYLMWREHTQHRVMQTLLWEIQAFRFCDNIHIAAIGRLIVREWKEIQQALKQMYSTGLDVELEGYGYNHVKFLDCWILCGSLGYMVGNYNKNIDYFGDSSINYTIK
jgi:hypothetical protein